MISKKEIRSRMKALEKEGTCNSGAIWEKVEALPEFKVASNVLLYMSIPGEVPTQIPLERWNTKRIAIPKVAGNDLLLKEYDAGQLESGYLGIMEPCNGARDVSPEDIGIAIIPGVAFDRAGRRLGHGKGFYDRLLPQLKCLKVGVCQSWRILDEVPCDDWDIPMDVIVSDL